LETTRARNPDGGIRMKVHEPVRIAEGVEIENAEIGPNVTIETGCKLKDVRLKDCIIGENVKIEYSDLHDSIIGDHAVVRKTTGTVNVGDRAQINA
jgi:glucose-1-phosphate thymidylyltransferase